LCSVKWKMRLISSLFDKLSDLHLQWQNFNLEIIFSCLIKSRFLFNFQSFAKVEKFQMTIFDSGIFFCNVHYISLTEHYQKSHIRTKIKSKDEWERERKIQKHIAQNAAIKFNKFYWQNVSNLLLTTMSFIF
jgi:hypothetical protein